MLRELQLQAPISHPTTLLHFSPSGTTSWPTKPTWLHPRGPMPVVGIGFPTTRPKRLRLRVARCGSGGEEARATDFASKAPVAAAKVLVTVKRTAGGILSNIGIGRGLDGFQDLLGRSLFLELLSAEVDKETGLEKGTISAYAQTVEDRDGLVTYEADLEIRPDFGPVGAIMVENEHRKEMFVKDIVLTGTYEPLVFSCNSWVQSKYDDPNKRVFFTTKSYLPSETPSGLLRVRKMELQNLRGDGQGERKIFERVYDYDVYNDLGDPSSPDTARPVLGGNENPYPRRCRTGRPRTEEDPLSETREGEWYVPRDESFSEVKEVTFNVTTLRSVLQAVVPAIRAALVDPDLSFPYFTAIQKLYEEGVSLAEASSSQASGGLASILPRIIKTLTDTVDDLLLFEMPETFQRDRFSWLRDEEFSRQAIAGLNPLGIQLVTEFPFVSKLDPNIYGPPESAITAEIIEREINSTMTTQEAVRQKRLFILDYHDFLLPYVHKVRELEGTTLYGSRTLFFRCDDNTLQPIAIELTRPRCATPPSSSSSSSSSVPQWKRVFTNRWDATDAWLWRLAKLHVMAHDSGLHELVSHWLRTHGCVEPYSIAAHRQLSEMHPVYRLLHPHFRYTMDINSLARQSLINAGGVIETSFSPKKYAMEISSAWYDQLWRFDMEGLPADLIRRGMAEADATSEHGLRLTIEDYPYASDGLLIWSAIKQWVNDYVSHYYPDVSTITSDSELQSWWTEVRTKGHADKKDEPWWPVIDSKDSLIDVLTTIIWVASGHHAAVNFGQYHFAGYFPNRPTIARKNIPNEDPDSEEFERFITRPEDILMEMFPSQVQATIVMAVLDVLSTHSVEEEYIGATWEETWKADPVIRAAYERFGGRLKQIEGIIDARNVDSRLKNRFGAGLVPYELLKPFSEPGMTGRGIPNSISI